MISVLTKQDLCKQELSKGQHARLFKELPLRRKYVLGKFTCPKKSIKKNKITKINLILENFKVKKGNNLAEHFDRVMYSCLKMYTMMVNKHSKFHGTKR